MLFANKSSRFDMILLVDIIALKWDPLYSRFTENGLWLFFPRVFRPCDLVIGDVIGKGFFGQVRKVHVHL